MGRECLCFARGKNTDNSWVEGGLWWVLRRVHILFFVTYHMGMSPNSSIFGYDLGSNEENIAEVMLHDL